MVEPELLAEEQAVVRAGVPMVVHERRGRPENPLVVFIPGAIHLARVGYGHPGSRPEDFIGHWFESNGWSFAAFSYPLEVATPAFSDVDPDLGLAQFAKAVAAHAHQRAIEWGLGQDIVVLGWSAAGNIAPRLNQELAALGRRLSLFVALAATPAIPDLIFGSLAASRAWAAMPTSFTDEGLLAHRGIRSFDDELVWLDERYEHTVLPKEVYHSSYVGNMPLNLFPGLGVRREHGQLVIGHDGPIAESLGTVWDAYPLVATLQPTWPLDDRHAVTDATNWSMVLANSLSRRWTAAQAKNMSPSTWSALVEVVTNAPRRLHRQIDGGHLFFVGEDGARETAEATFEFVAAAAELADLLDDLIETSEGI